MIDMVEARESPIHGRGAFATQRIGARAFIGRYTGRRTQSNGTHVLWVEGNNGEYCGIDGDSVLRWLNHSSNPNVEFDGPDLYAKHAIEADEELCFHYGEEWEDVS